MSAKIRIEQLDNILGQGTSNWVYSLKDNHKVAVKISKNRYSTLDSQARILTLLSNTNAFPKLEEFGELQISGNSTVDFPSKVSYIAMEKLGMSLEQLLVVREGKLSITTIAKIGNQLLQNMKILHFRNIAHNDIKPSNILFGLKEKRSQLFIVDFGLADLANQNTFPSFQNQQFKGNIKYASVNKLKGLPWSANDDIESLLYIVLWMLFGGRTIWSVNTDTSKTQNDMMSLSQKLRRQMDLKLALINNADILSKLLQSDQKRNMFKNVLDLLYTLNHSPNTLKYDEICLFTERIFSNLTL